MKNRGFTLIELIVVLAVVGILAGALMVAINPLEQTRKATDASNVSKAKDIVTAGERYYASFQADPAPCDVATLVTANELKSGVSYTGITLACAVGTYTASFTPVSTTYTTKCAAKGVAACEIPGDFQ